VTDQLFYDLGNPKHKCESRSINSGAFLADRHTKQKFFRRQRVKTRNRSLDESSGIRDNRLSSHIDTIWVIHGMGSQNPSEQNFSKIGSLTKSRSI
jgi:hypothetical protein